MGLQLNEWKNAKKKLNLSYDDLAKMTGYSRSTITNIFCGYIDLPRHETVQAIEKALGLDKVQEERDKKATDLYDLASPELRQIFDIYKTLSQEEIVELKKFVEFLISKR